MKINEIKAFWQRGWWSKLIIIFVGIFILSAIIGGFTPQGQKSFKEGQAVSKGTSENQETPTPKVEKKENKKTSVPTKKPSPTVAPKPKPVSFDSNLGNNYVAANFAKDFFGIANKAASGYIKSVRVDLMPEDLGGKSEKDYKEDLTSVYLTVEVDSYLWSTTGESGQKDLAASFLNSISNTFGGIRHVIITNGVRTVAKAEWPLFGGDPKITLK